MELLPFEDGQEMLGPFQVSEPMTSVSHQPSALKIFESIGLSLVRILTNVKSSEQVCKSEV